VPAAKRTCRTASVGSRRPSFKMIPTNSASASGRSDELPIAVASEGTRRSKEAEPTPGGGYDGERVLLNAGAGGVCAWRFRVLNSQAEAMRRGISRARTARSNRRAHQLSTFERVLAQQAESARLSCGLRRPSRAAGAGRTTPDPRGTPATSPVLPPRAGVPGEEHRQGTQSCVLAGRRASTSRGRADTHDALPGFVVSASAMLPPGGAGGVVGIGGTDHSHTAARLVEPYDVAHQTMYKFTEWISPLRTE
jgi:hypothetical protein